MINPMDLSGRHIIVTGASSGIGAEICRHIARLGGKVTLVARSEERLRGVLQSMEGEGHAYRLLDLSRPEDIEPEIASIREVRGVFDGCVYSAGIGDTCPLKQTKPDRVAQIAAINYLSYVEFVRCVTLRKNRANRMSIVGISSVASARGEKGKTMYCSAKAAMDGAMRAMAHELAGNNIRINNVLPGWVNTDMYDEAIRVLGDENVKKEFELIQYMGAPLEPVDVANAVAFLLSDGARFITGTSMVVAGGALT